MATREARPDSVTIGEVVDTPGLQRTYEGRLDGCLDFVLLQGLRAFFAFGDTSASEFDAFLRRHLAFFGDGMVLPSFLDNHDMNRIAFLAEGDQARVRLGALMLFALSGPPIVYYGTEAGLSQERPIHQNDFGIFEEARLPMDWTQAQPDQPLPDYFRRLALLRQAHPALQTGTRRLLHLDAVAGTYAFMREWDADRAAVAVNLSASPVTLALPVRGFNPDAWDRLNDCPVRVSADSVEVDLPAWGGALLS
jgi:glycosidase